LAARRSVERIDARITRWFARAFAAFAAVATAEAQFTHPGCLSTQSDLSRMTTKVSASAEPWKGSWDILVSNTNGWLSHTPEAVATVYADSTEGSDNYIRVARDAARAYQLALRYHGSGDTRFADKAVQILNAWASINTSWGGNTNVSLRKGIYGYQFACAAELLRGYSGWQGADFTAFQNYMVDMYYSGNTYFLTVHHGTVDGHYWANWDLANMASMLAIGVLADRQDIFDQAMNYFYSGVGNGAIGNAVHFVHPNGLGQWQESGRDQGHSLMGPQLMGVFCEIAWNQGIDLYGYLGNRFLSGVEYISKYNVWNEVPYVKYVYRSGHPGSQQETFQTWIGDLSRGTIRPGWDMVYNHYVNRLGMAAPHTAEYTSWARPEGGGFNYGTTSGGFDGLGFTTLTHSREPIASGAAPSALRPCVKGRQITLSWSGSAYAQSYNVKRSTNSGGPYTTVAKVGAKNLSYVNPGLVAGTTYYYVVSANNPGGEGGNSSEVAATASGELHGAVIGTEGSWNYGATKDVAFDGSLDNYFDAPSDGAWVGLDLGAGVNAVITGVKFCPREGFAYRMVGGKFQGSNTADFSSGVVDLFTISSAPPGGVLTSQSISNGTPFRYVRYIVPAGTGGWNNVAEVQFHGNVSGLSAPSSAPSAPTATGNLGEINLSWSAVSGADSYNVKRATTRGGPYVIEENTPATSLRQSGLSGGTYYYVVSAVNSAGESSASGEFIGQALGNVGPVATSANDDNGEWSAAEVAASAFDEDADTKWFTGGGYSSGWLQADLGVGNEAVVVRYDLTSANDAQGRDPKNWELLGSNDGTNWTTLDTRNNETFASRYLTQQYSFANSTAYRFYRLNILSNYSGNSSDGIQLAELSLIAAGSGSGGGEAEADTTPPAVPAGLTATSGVGSVSLDWADNAETDLDRYTVYRSTTSGSGYVAVASGLTTSGYTDSDVTNGTTYYYVVTATDTPGNESFASGEAFATPELPLPSPWVNADIGAVGAAGLASHASGTFTVEGSGADIWGSADEFHYVHQIASGDCSIVARVASIENTDSQAKVGLMIREGTAANARNAAVLLTPGTGVRFQRRTSVGGTTANNSTNGITAPRWLKLTRSGNTFRAYYSSDAVSWTQFGGNRTISMGTTVTIGIAVSSRNDGTLCTGILNNVVATP
jgi:fibronectin type 3 domain-containing protein